MRYVTSAGSKTCNVDCGSSDSRIVGPQALVPFDPLAHALRNSAQVSMRAANFDIGVHCAWERGPTLLGMARSLVERRLVDLADRLKRLRDDLRVADEQLMQLRDEADDARLRSLVSETSVAAKEHRQAAKQLEKLENLRQDVAADIAKHEAKSDELLDQMMERRNG